MLPEARQLTNLSVTIRSSTWFCRIATITIPVATASYHGMPNHNVERWRLEVPGCPEYLYLLSCIMHPWPECVEKLTLERLSPEMRNWLAGLPAASVKLSRSAKEFGTLESAIEFFCRGE